MPNIHPTSVVDPRAELADDVVVGPFCYVENGVVIGAGTRLDSHVTVKWGVTIGERNLVCQGAIIGGQPQDRRFKNEPTYVRIGDDNVFREYVTIHRATGEGNATTVANNCYLMAYCHMGHNAALHDTVTLANSVGLSGHVTVEELATIGGMVGVHQYVRIGKVSMVGGYSKITRDVPPFMLSDGQEQRVIDINAVGLRRIQVSASDRLALHKACKLLFKSQMGLSAALATVEREVPHTAEVDYLLMFMRRIYGGKSGRGDQP